MWTEYKEQATTECVEEAAGKTDHRHPLEPLSAAELKIAVSVLQAGGEFLATTRIISITLKEPGKALVYRWPDNPRIDRQATAVTLDNATREVKTVDLNLTRQEIVQIIIAPEGSQPTLTVDEQVECEQAVLNSPLFKDALKRQYGLNDTSLVMVDIWSAGNYGAEEESTQRLTRPLCFLRAEANDNGYARPIEGLRPVVDINKMEVIRVEEYGKWELPPNGCNYAAGQILFRNEHLRPLHISQPEGPGFSLVNHCIRWQDWELVIGFSAREGLTLHNICYQDGARKRSILYRASMDEMVVPYGDPAPTQARKNAFDVGEYGMGACANSLRLGCDCLGHIEYLDAHLASSRGEVYTIPNAICIHEEDFGILWKHTDRRLADRPEVRRSRRLVISSISTVENYEYGFFWYFYLDGNIQFEIKLTGILSLGTVREGESPKYGTMIAPLLYAPNHQHFFNARLDFDIDGERNTVYQVDVIAGAGGDDNPFHNAFYAQSKALTRESEAKANLDITAARTWRIVNPNVKNATGEPVGYKFFPGDNAVPFASPEAWWRKRAGFVDHHVWVTPFSESEQFAAGDFPNQSRGGDGLPAWTARDRGIADQDVVFWYTFGHTHLPRLEDYPVMPTAYIGFLLKPSGFFDHNPANDLPPSSVEGVNGSQSNGCCAESSHQFNEGAD
ncbi:Monoamine oxidase [Acidisarcina polymorpha]|uniref:Amine oxidase n=1 Tax=Acidisarcina polymorpha TaxID=2211140 RepID=A0A2Z5G497_9BACT|nr:primary-amine oxidase [Acidisarcina polymorpha]AXC13901.1 Monoamine oxidase [Acidisarcina polymorpha]